jgi:hypothetical protein
VPLQAARVSGISHQDPAVAGDERALGLEAVDPYALPFAESGQVDKDNVRRITFPALFEEAESIEIESEFAGLRAPVDVDHRQGGSAVDTHSAGVLRLSVTGKRDP